MNDEAVVWRIDDGIGHLVLNRPEKANAIGLDTARCMVKAIDALLAADPRVILLQARGRIFCAGGDIDEFVAAGDKLGELVDAILDILHPAFLRLCNAPVPLVAEVNGPIGGAGVGLALSADFVLASTNMKLRTGYSALGLSPDMGTSWFLARRAGPARAQQLLIRRVGNLLPTMLATGSPVGNKLPTLRETVDAAQCFAWGLVDELHAPEDLPAAALGLAQDLAKSSRTSVAAIKALGAGCLTRTLEQQLNLEHRHLRACAETPDAKEGVAAFAGRRPPNFPSTHIHSVN